ncbi:hypothetical protein ASD83_01140 [Devosia sp. Root685]|uniref:phosphotransferase n=1 Tax=Devosia sp. Root685 TaxID=1736587 RepID=UPI0006F6FE98|nr:phosphotransferase [Devosia sp. Root685]KRA99167.1 hypothetical protein ASD83_01140 [Devosia sp. Root685]
MADEEVALHGGLVNGVVRVGNTVRRRHSGDFSVQHALLAHLAAKGFGAAPRFLGYDEQGREMLTYLEGHVPVGEGNFTDSQLAAAARLLRAFHDATVDFPLVLAGGHEVVCHNDWTPTNTVMTDGVPTGMIDFDTARPGLRLWDLTYSVWTWLDFGEPRWDPAEQRRRMAHFIAAYDHPSCTPGLVTACLPGRQAGRAHWAEQRGMREAVDWCQQCMSWTLDNITAHFHPDGLH